MQTHTRCDIMSYPGCHQFTNSKYCKYNKEDTVQIQVHHLVMDLSVVLDCFETKYVTFTLQETVQDIFAST